MKRILLNALLITLVGFAANTHATVEVVSDGPRSVANLGGEWKVRPVEGLNLVFPPPNEGWQTQEVPSPDVPSIKSTRTPYGPSLNTILNEDGSALARQTDMAVWFKREFELPASAPKEKRILLHFGGMAFKSEVWLNGQRLGGSIFGQVPISYDVTEVVRWGKPNELVVGLADREGLVDVENQTYIAPVSGVAMGIWGKVELQFLPEIRVDDVFVKTHVKDQKIELDVTLLNASQRQADVSVGGLIRDVKQDPVTEIDAVAVTLAAGESKTITLTKDWIAPQLWSPANPALYFAEVQVIEDGKLEDASQVRFGFREFEIRGHDFYLNGVRTVLLRESNLRSLTTDREALFAEVRGKAGNPYNCIRLHLGFNSEALLDACDELGILTVPESAWHNTFERKTPRSKVEIWLPGVEEYTRQMIQIGRAHV